MLKQKMIRVKNKPGLLIQKPVIGVFRPMLQRFYNGVQTDDGVRPVDKEWDVPADQYHLRKLAKGELLLADKKSEAPKKKPGRPPKTEDKK